MNVRDENKRTDVVKFESRSSIWTSVITWHRFNRVGAYGEGFDAGYFSTNHKVKALMLGNLTVK